VGVCEPPCLPGGERPKPTGDDFLTAPMTMPTLGPAALKSPTSAVLALLFPVLTFLMTRRTKGYNLSGHSAGRSNVPFAIGWAEVADPAVGISCPPIRQATKSQPRLRAFRWKSWSKSDLAQGNFSVFVAALANAWKQQRRRHPSRPGAGCPQSASKVPRALSFDETAFLPPLMPGF